MNPMVVEPTPGPDTPPGDVQPETPFAAEPAVLQIAATTRIVASPSPPTPNDFLLERFMAWFSLLAGGRSDALAESLGRELALPAQQEDEDGEREHVGQRVQG